MVENQNKLFIPYWIFSILGTLIFIVTIIIACTDYRGLFFDNLTLHLFSCGLLGVISAGIQTMLFDKNSLFVLTKKDNKSRINIGLKIALFFFLAYSSLFYIFENPNFKKEQMIIGFIFWVSNLFSLEILEYYINYISGKKYKFTTYEFNEKNKILYGVLILFTLLACYYSELKSNSTQSFLAGKDMSNSFDIYHAISAIIIGILASLHYMLIKRVFLSRIKENGLEIFFWIWISILLFLLFFYYWISALFFFFLITIPYFMVILIIKPISTKAQFFISSILILILFYMSGALTLAALRDYPKNSFLEISITNICFWVANIFTPIAIEKVRSCPNVPT